MRGPRRARPSRFSAGLTSASTRPAAHRSEGCPGALRHDANALRRHRDASVLTNRSGAFPPRVESRGALRVLLEPLRPLLPASRREPLPTLHAVRALRTRRSRCASLSGRAISARARSEVETSALSRRTDPEACVALRAAASECLVPTTPHARDHRGVSASRHARCALACR